MKVPAYIATCTVDDTVTHWGGGDTPAAALAEFEPGDFAAWCAYQLIPQGETVAVFVYTAVAVEDSDYSPDELDPDWQWVLNDLISTHALKAPGGLDRTELSRFDMGRDEAGFIRRG